MKFYLSHAIRGKTGPDADADTQNINCLAAIEIAKDLRALFPKIDLYVPGEHETFVKIAYDSGHLSEKQILDIDCKIIDNCCGVIVYVPCGDTLQGGRKIEFDHAFFTKKPVQVFQTVEQIEKWIAAQFLRA